MDVEKLIADTINNNPIKLKFRGKEISIPRPTLGTLIEVSKEISKFPEFSINSDYASMVQQTLKYAKDCSMIAKIIAILILGKKNLYKKISFFGLSFTIRDRLKELTSEVENMTSQECSELLVAIFSQMDCGFFLGIITSLSGVNQLKKTKNETTASGQQ